MTGDRIEVRGRARLQRSTRDAARALADLTDANKQAADVARRVAARKAPARSGRLRSSIRADGTRTDAVVTAGAPYAGVIEYGWPARNITAHGYLRDGLASSEKDWLPVYERAAQHALDQVKGI